MILIPLILFLLLFGVPPIYSSSSNGAALLADLTQGARLEPQPQQYASTATTTSSKPPTPTTIASDVIGVTAAYNSKNNSSYTNNKPKEPDKAQLSIIQNRTCYGIHVRNDLRSFEQLRGCNIIDGPLTIALLSNNTRPYEPEDFKNISFPELREISDYLIFFRVQGLSTLSKLFPNLAVIRGREVVENYAFIVYEMMQLQEINLPKLSDILEGSVRIERNWNLCYAPTVNWDKICKRAFIEHVIKDNNPRCSDQCRADCEPWHLEGTEEKMNESSLKLHKSCWNSSTCHQPCKACTHNSYLCAPDGSCCSSQCAGGCYRGNRPDQCVSCRAVSQLDKCVEKCDFNLFEYKGRCITEEECISIHLDSSRQAQCNNRLPDRSLYMKPMRLLGEEYGKCLSTCPSNYEEDPSNRNKCKLCDKGKCRKICTHSLQRTSFQVTDVNSLKELQGCKVINGSLEISMKGGKNALHELEETFKDLEEIGGYLKITRTQFLLTLGFLENLKYINGSKLDRSEYALSIINNPNLQELFLFNHSENHGTKRLTISGGRISVHLNPKLCPHRIDYLKTYANVKDWDEKDVSTHTNGDKEACNVDKLEVKLDRISSKFASLRYENYAKKMDDPRSLLSYLINYREAPSKNITMFDGRDGCYGDAWTTIEEPAASQKQEYKEALIEVKPATQYALYIKTFTIQAQNNGALSDIIYFTSTPHTPGIPREISSKATSQDSLTVSWFPPSKPNGYIERYILTIKKVPEIEALGQSDICNSEEDKNRVLESFNDNEKVKTDASERKEPSSDVTPQPNQEKAPINEAENKADSINFQDTIVDIIFLKPPCTNPLNNTYGLGNGTKPTRKKRAISFQPFSTNLTKTSPENHRAGLIQSHETYTIPPPKPGQPIIQAIKFINVDNRMKVNITVDGESPKKRLSYTIENLEHYTNYEMEVVACHGIFIANQTYLTTKQYSQCGLPAMTQVRTAPIENNDIILPETIRFIPANETSKDNIITWNKPYKPNGLVLAYNLRYRPISASKEYWYKCITPKFYEQNKGLIKLSNISPGRYILNIQALTMYAGSRLWSEPDLEFEIPNDGLLSPLAIGALIIILFVFVSSIAYATCYYQKHKHDANGLLYASVNPDYIQYEADEWEVAKENLIIHEQIGTGSFGLVYKGELIKDDKVRIECAIKTVPTTSTAKHRMDFLREASIMKQFDTYHIVKLFGVVSISTPVYVVMELMINKDLKSYLRKVREKHEKENKPLVDGIHLMAAQIADGMAYLAAQKFVHRDLAARNCLVASDQTVKIGDFGLTRDVLQNEYYRRGTQARLPVRWMAPEALSDNIYTSASDIWSYGIVLWEIVTFGAYPYQGLSNDEVLKRVVSGQTLSRPLNCPTLLYNMMQKCWRRNPSERPKFAEMIEVLLAKKDAQLNPNCYYKKQKTEANNIVQSSPEESINTIGTESYPLLSWPSTRTNGLTNSKISHATPEIDE